MSVATQIRPTHETSSPPAAPSGGATRVNLLSFPLVSAKRPEAAKMLCERAERGEPTTVNFINAHCVNVAARDRGYERAVRRSDYLMPDGSGLRIAAAMSGVDYLDNLNGTDLFPELCAQAAGRGLSLYLLGGVEGAAAAAGRAMKDQFPALHVAGAFSGYFTPGEEADVIEAINASGADFLLVGFGVPLQEKWIERNRERLTVPVVMGVGGLFDYYSGRIPRAPLVLRQLGCEWVWRLAQEPSRLARRYLVGNLSFVARTAFWLLAAVMRSASRHESLKRVLDLIVTASALLAALPVFIAAAAAIKLEDGGPVFFRQVRVGRDGRPFVMFKFRSMVVDAEKRLAALRASSERDGVCFKMKRDPRITRCGALLRRTSLDELPQLLNVLRGEMSLVGPRPALPAEAATYQGRSWRRLDGKPGITCIWQVSGRAEIPFERQVTMDVAYLRRRSVWTDLALLVRTVPAVMTARGAY